MHVYQDPNGGFKKPRVHPFVATKPREAGSIDFKRHPHRIAEVLEDFVPLAHIPAVQTFYRFLAWLNGPASVLESCDCALRGPEKNHFDESHHSLCVHGRLMLMYRDLSANCDDRYNFLFNTLGRELSCVDAGFTRSQGSVGFASSPALYKSLVRLERINWDGYVRSYPGDPGRGYQLMLLFKAFGDDPNEAFTNLEQIFTNIQVACQRIMGKLSPP